jgi:hypothetical protein
MIVISCLLIITIWIVILSSVVGCVSFDRNEFSMIKIYTGEKADWVDTWIPKKILVLEDRQTVDEIIGELINERKNPIE